MVVTKEDEMLGVVAGIEKLSPSYGVTTPSKPFDWPQSNYYLFRAPAFIKQEYKYQN